MSGYEVASLTGVESLPGRIAALDAAAQALRDHGVRAQRLHGDRGRPGRRRGAQRGAPRPRGDLRRRLRSRDVRARRGRGRGAGRLGCLPQRPEAEALRPCRGAGDDRARDRRQAGAARDLGLGVLLRRLPEGRPGDFEAPSPSSTPASRRSPTTRRSSTIAPASSPGRAARRGARIPRPGAEGDPELKRWADEDEDLASYASPGVVGRRHGRVAPERDRPPAARRRAPRRSRPCERVDEG